MGSSKLGAPSPPSQAAHGLGAGSGDTQLPFPSNLQTIESLPKRVTWLEFTIHVFLFATLA